MAGDKISDYVCPTIAGFRVDPRLYDFLRHFSGNPEIRIFSNAYPLFFLTLPPTRSFAFLFRPHFAPLLPPFAIASLTSPLPPPVLPRRSTPLLPDPYTPPKWQFKMESSGNFSANFLRTSKIERGPPPTHSSSLKSKNLQGIGFPEQLFF